MPPETTHPWWQTGVIHQIYPRSFNDSTDNGVGDLGNYANFLWQVRQEMDQTEAFYKQAIEADPNHASILGNYAGFLLAQGKTEEGLPLLQRALDLAERPSYDSLLLEVLSLCECAR